MIRDTARMARLERAMIAGIAAYVLVMQMMLAEALAAPVSARTGFPAAPPTQARAPPGAA